jgi:hypothetical protein
MRDSFLQAFADRWHHVNTMTVEFAKSVPNHTWDSSPLSGFAPFSKQLRHVVCVRGVYNEGLKTGRVEFDRKHDFYDGTLTRTALIAALEATHTDLMAQLPDLPPDVFEPSIDFFGNRVSQAQYLYGYVQHEAIHHGQWSIYAASGGYETPEIWRLQWGLSAGSA